MKTLLMAFVLFGCASVTDGEFKKKYHLEDYKSAMAPADLHKLLTEKMTKCYPQKEYPVYEKTVSQFNPETESGDIVYEIDNQSMGPQPLLIVEVIKDPEGSVARVFSKGSVFHPAGVYKHQVKKWVDGLKVDCQSHGKI